MTKAKAVSVIYSSTPQTSEQLLEAIKSLGTSQEEIRKNLIKLGFKNANQQNPKSCPVCRYLISIGLNSPYVTIDEIGTREFCTPISIKNTAMGRFQIKAGKGEVKGIRSDVYYKD